MLTQCFIFVNFLAYYFIRRVGGFIPSIELTHTVTERRLANLQSSTQVITSSTDRMSGPPDDGNRDQTVRLYSSIFATEDAEVIEKAMDILLTSNKHRRYLTNKMYVDLLKLAITIQNVDYSMKLFSKLLSFSVTLDITVFQRLLYLVNEKSSSPTHLPLLFKEYQKQGYLLDFRFVYDLLSQATQLENIQFLLGLVQRFGFDLNSYHFNLALGSRSNRIRDLSTALYIYETMRVFDIKPNVVTLMQLLLSASNAEEGDVLLNLFREFRTSFPDEINPTIYGMVLVGCVKCELWEEFDSLIGEMVEKNIPFHQETVILCLKNLKSDLNPPEFLPSTIGFDRSWPLVPGSMSGPRRSRVKQFLAKFLPLLQNVNATLFQAAMDEVRFTHPQIVIDIYEIIKQQSYVPISTLLNRQIFSYGLRAALRLSNYSLSTRILQDTFDQRLDTMYYYNITISSLKRARKYDLACQVLLTYLKNRENRWGEEVDFPPSHLYSITNNKIGGGSDKFITSSFIQQELQSCQNELSSMISFAILEITKNYALLFDAPALSSSNQRKTNHHTNQPDSHYVENLLIILQKLVIPYQIPLDPIGYPLACKLLLDGKDFVSLSPLLKQASTALSSKEETSLSKRVNITRLFDTTYHGMLNQIVDINQYRHIESSLLHILHTIHETEANSSASLASYLLIKTFYKLFSLLPSHHRTAPGATSTKHLSDSPQLQQGVYNAIFELYRQSYQLYASSRQSYPVKIYSLFSSKSIHFHHPDEFYYSFTQYLLADDRVSSPHFPDKTVLLLLLQRLSSHPIHYPLSFELIEKYSQQLDCTNDAMVMTELLIAYANTNNYALLIKLMSEFHGSSGSIVKITTKMMTVVIQCCLKNSRIYEAQLLLIFMRQQQIPRSVSLYQQIFHSCAKLGHWNDAVDVYFMMICDQELYTKSLSTPRSLKQSDVEVLKSHAKEEAMLEGEEESSAADDLSTAATFNEEELFFLSSLVPQSSTTNKNKILASLKEITKLLASNRLFKTVTPSLLQQSMDYNLEKDASFSFLSKFFKESISNYQRLKVDLRLLFTVTSASESVTVVTMTDRQLARQLLFLFAAKPDKYSTFLKDTLHQCLKQGLLFPFSFLLRGGIPFYSYCLPVGALASSTAAGAIVVVLILQLLKQLLITVHGSSSFVQDSLLNLFLDKHHLEDEEFIQRLSGARYQKDKMIDALISKSDYAFNSFLQEYRGINFNMKVTVEEIKAMIESLHAKILSYSPSIADLNEIKEETEKRILGKDHIRVDIYPEAVDQVLQYLRDDWKLSIEDEVTIVDLSLANVQIKGVRIPYAALKRVLTSHWFENNNESSVISR